MPCKKTEYGNWLNTIGNEPSMQDLIYIVENYKATMKALGYKWRDHAKEARLVRGPAHELGLYRPVGWHLRLHDEGCCYR